jgi:tetratricopeptide (TPR) repeat protein
MLPTESPPIDKNHNDAIELMVRVERSLSALATVDKAPTIEDTIQLVQEAHAPDTENSPSSIDAYLLLAKSLFQHFQPYGIDVLLDEITNLGEQILIVDPFRFMSCIILAKSLSTRYKSTGDVGLLEQAINLEREALDLLPIRHPHRSQFCGALAISLKEQYERTGDAGSLDRAIDLERKALDLLPIGHLYRSRFYRDLAISLKKQHGRTGDVSLLDEAIDMEREALGLDPTGHPDRSISCGNLAISLKKQHGRTGDVGLLDEAIHLEREALHLCPVGHSDRSTYCGNLAASLSKQYERTGDVSLLDEALDLEREALHLRPTGHQDRLVSCAGLATVLMSRYECTGVVSLLDEVIDLQREALYLHPIGHPDRPVCGGNLAGSLIIRYQRTSDVNLLEEAVDLLRQALDLRPAGHPDRAVSCGNLASPLMTLYERKGDDRFLYEAIILQREALDLCPAEHPYRSVCCENQATFLMAGYKNTGKISFLNEAIDLDRQTLGFRPAGHPNRSRSCGKLAYSLIELYWRTDDVALLDESVALIQEAVTVSPAHEIWMHLHSLALALLQRASPFYDVPKAIFYLSQSLQHDTNHPVAFVISLSSLLDNLWQCNTEGKYIQLTTIYQRFVSLLPLLIHPSLGLQPQLQALKKCTQLGSDAFVNAALVDDWSAGLETLELAQGVIWSTTLHRRDPQLKDVPPHLASKLQGVLQSLAMSSGSQPDQWYEERKPFTSPRDILHAQSARLYTVIQEIRAHPGLERFMLGESVGTLRTAASDHPVVVLVGARGHHYALILAASLVEGHAFLSLNLSDEDLTSLSFNRGTTRAHRSDATLGETPDQGDRVGLKKTELASSKPLDGQLQTLWHKVVKPVLAHLGLEVSSRTSLDDTFILTNNTYVSRLGVAVPEHACIGVLLESSAICLYTLQGFTTAHTRFAALTL